jgi:hypothetical protein
MGCESGTLKKSYRDKLEVLTTAVSAECVCNLTLWDEAEKWLTNEKIEKWPQTV